MPVARASSLRETVASATSPPPRRQENACLIATKGGLTRQGPDRWTPVGRPEYRRQCVQMGLRRLGVERIDLWQRHRIDPKVPQREPFEVIRETQTEGLIRHAGLSEVSVDEIEAAREMFGVVTVQNRDNLIGRGSEAVLDPPGRPACRSRSRWLAARPNCRRCRT